MPREVSSSEASATDVIPSVRALRRLLSKEADTNHGIKPTKTALLEDRYFDEDVKQHARATLDA